MKRTFRYVFAAMCVSLAACSSMFESSGEKLQENFQRVPESHRVAVYWYWMSDNISVEGVEHDLEAMKKAGIGRAFIGNIWEGSIPAGPHKVLSDGWWEVMHAALKKATELDIEIGIFNCPGWSQSGGPWVTPQESMRYLAGAQTTATGNGGMQTLQLPPLPKDARDERVLAYPNMSDRYVSQTVDVHRTAGADQQQDVTFDEPVSVRSITFETPGYMLVNVIIQALVNDEYVTLKTVHLDRTNAALNVGFVPQSPIVVALPDTETKDIRLVITGGPSDFDVRVTVSTEPRVERFAEKSLAKMFQTPLPMWGEYMWPTAAEPSEDDLMVQPVEVMDITDKLAEDGTLTWEVPDGTWTILRTGLAPTLTTNAPASPEATGLEVDKMSRQHVATHFDAFLGEILRRIPAADRKSFKIVVEDSYETGGQNWTDDMIDVFRARYHYDPVPYLPALYGQVIGSQDQSERFLWDLRRLVADRVAYDYVGGLREVSNKHGLTTWLECYGHWGFPSEFLMYGGQSDEVAGEFWSEGSLGDIENRAASSCAHIYGKQKVWAESCTAAGAQFNRYPRLMKQRIDHFFCEGINASLLHLFISQPDNKKPGLDAWFGNEFNRNNSWFEGMTTFIDYLKRCSMMLQQGRYVADVAYFIGEDVPKMTGTCAPPLPKGYSFDYINGDVILNHSKVVDSKLILDSGMSYNLLVLPKQTTMRPQILERIHQFVEQGLTIVGPRPQQSPSMQDYPNADNKVRNLASQIWNNTGKCGNGRVYNDGTPIETILRNQSIEPDFSYTGQASLEFIHRTLNDEGEIYFISNQEDSIRTVNLSFRASKWTCAELWNPQTGETRYLECNKTSNRIEAEITLAQLESVFVVFCNKAVFASDKASHTTKITIDREPWKVYFAPSAGKPSFTKSYTKLEDWTLAKDDDIKYYSGNATYSNSFILQKQPGKDAHVKLNIGEVMVLATVKINGHDAGGVWTHPYSLDITPYVRQGENRIEITVYNNWRNRLIADEKLLASERLTWTNIQPWSKTDELQHSGLLKPVSIEIDE